MLDQTGKKRPGPGPEDWVFEVYDSGKGFDGSTDAALIQPENLSDAVNISLDRGNIRSAFGMTYLFGATNYYPAHYGVPQQWMNYTVGASNESLLVTTKAVFRAVPTGLRPIGLQGGSIGAVNGDLPVGSTSITGSFSFTIGKLYAAEMFNETWHLFKATTAGLTTIMDQPNPKEIQNGAVLYEVVQLNGVETFGVSWDQWAAPRRLYFTNGVDTPYVYNGTDLRPLQGLGASIFTCRCLCVAHNYLLLFNTIEDGDIHPQRFRWSQIGTDNTWDWDINFGDLFESPDEIQTAFPLNEYVAVYKRRSIFRLIHVGQVDQTWDWEKTVDEIGAVSARSVVRVRNGHFVMGDTNVYVYTGEFTITPIGGDIASILGGPDLRVSRSDLDRVCSTYIEATDEVLWAIPSFAEALGTTWDTGVPWDTEVFWSGEDDFTPGTESREILCYNIYQQSWTRLVQPFSVTMLATAQLSLDPSWDDISSTWQGSDFAWVDAATSGRTEIVAIGAGGQVPAVYRRTTREDTILGSVFNYRIDTKDFLYKHWKFRTDQFVFHYTGGPLRVQYSVDRGVSWNALGTLTGAPDRWVRRSLWKQIATDIIRLRVIGSMAFEMNYLGFSWKHESRV